MNFFQWLIDILAISFIIDFALSNRTNSSRPKVVGGFPIKIQQVPYLLALHSRDGFKCGGVIISPVWVMSALHCIGTDDPIKSYYVRAGTTLSLPVGPRYRIRNIYNYSSEMSEYPTIPEHDIVLIRLRDRIQYTRRTKPAKLPREDSEPPEELRVFGWGATERTEIKRGSIRLLAAKVHRVSYEDCIALNYGNMVKKERHLCYGGDGVDACHGDSGGPLGDASTVYGIVSFGDGCAVFPGVYVKLSSYRRWIKSLTRI